MISKREGLRETRRVFRTETVLHTIACCEKTTNAEVINCCTHCIDLHTATLDRSNFPQLRISPKDIEAERLARAFNAPILLHAKLREGSLRQYAASKNIPMLLYEAGQALRFDEFSIRTGVKGVLQVMHALGMLKVTPSQPSKISMAIARNSYWVRSPHSGIIQTKKVLGAIIKKGELLTKIGSPLTLDDSLLHSPISGILIGRSNLPLIKDGQFESI